MAGFEAGGEVVVNHHQNPRRVVGVVARGELGSGVGVTDDAHSLPFTPARFFDGVLSRWVAVNQTLITWPALVR